ncbi:glycosyltransferase family 4 protein [Erythrobacter sp. SG61-1L]|uniref:glycosyltransferase family 4 protein n=1 Tax=Erythrobacter sp. SG61-1L TaxID=1603897 RepID=UPI0006C91FAF|nr:glycosyltransferase family 4 protein [Erythrobacter sp. SG61-1L]
MLRVFHLLDDFGMGGVTNGLRVFDDPVIAELVNSMVLPIDPRWRLAPHLPDADVIVTHFPPAWNNLPFFRTLRLRNPHAHLVHVEHTYTAAYERRRVPRKARFRAMLRLALSARAVDEIVCVSRAQARWLRQAAGLDTTRCRTIYPWSCKDELLKIDPVAPRRGQPLRLGCYGRLATVKNFGPLIEACKRFCPGEIELLVGGYGTQEDELRVIAGDAANIRFHGEVKDLAGFMAQCDAIVMPSLWEAYGQVATEARLAARPILVADIDGLPEQVGGAGLCVRLDTADAIEAAIRRFRMMPLTQMALSGRAAARMIGNQVRFAWRDLFTRVSLSRA